MREPYADPQQEIEFLLAAIRRHRDYRGDDRCYKDDTELYQSLPEGYKVPEEEVEIDLNLCAKFKESRKNPSTTYISPQRKIEQLQSNISAVHNLCSALEQENIRLQKWIRELQNGGSVNCVYCGENFGPIESTEVALADILKKHMLSCVKHPLAAMKQLVYRAFHEGFDMAVTGIGVHFNDIYTKIHEDTAHHAWTSSHTKISLESL